MTEFNFRITKEGKIYTEGIDYGAGHQDLVIVKETKDFYLARKKGHIGFVCLGSQGDYSPEFIFLRKINEKTLDDISFGSDFEYSRETKKEVFKKALKKLEELQKESDQQHG